LAKTSVPVEGETVRYRELERCRKDPSGQALPLLLLLACHVLFRFRTCVRWLKTGLFLVPHGCRGISPRTRSPKRGLVWCVEGGCDLLINGRAVGNRGPGRQSSPTIATKVLVPRCVDLLDRLRPLELVARARRSACPWSRSCGLGKTSLAVAWADRLLRSGNSVAWLSIAPSDNQPAEFMFYSPVAMCP